MLIALSLASFVGGGSAQTIRGTVVNDSTQLPIPGALVRLLNDAGDQRASVLTNEQGEFAMSIGATARAYWVRVEHPSYEVIETRPFVFGRSEHEKSLVLRTRPRLVSLAGVTGRASSAHTRNYAGFLSRQRAGWGRFLDPEALERQRVRRASDLLVGLVPGLDVVMFGPGAGTVVFRNRGRVCSPPILVDGVVYDPRGSGGPTSVDEIVVGNQIRAVEIYSQPTFVPAELTLSPFNNCGAIVIWTEFGLGTQ
jgi:hypothetical protein